MWTQDELDEEQEVMEILHQRSMDEQADLLDDSERRDEVLWRTANSVSYAVETCGLTNVARELLSHRPELLEEMKRLLEAEKRFLEKHA